MASAQCQKPYEQTHHQQQVQYQKTTDKKHNEQQHTFTDKVKDMAHKMFNHDQDHQGGQPAPNHAHKPTGTAHSGVKTETKKKKKKIVKKTEGNEGHCIPRMLDHMKNKKKKNNKERKHSGSGSDSGSSSDSDSDHEAPKKKN